MAYNLIQIINYCINYAINIILIRNSTIMVDFMISKKLFIF